jgi:hypothetical protein
MKKSVVVLLIVLAVVIIAVSIFFILNNKPEVSPKEQACINSGGTVQKVMCCGQTNDFPNLCATGACGCSLENSHNVSICDCGENKCFDGNGCVSAEFNQR